MDFLKYLYFSETANLENWKVFCIGSFRKEWPEVTAMRLRTLRLGFLAGPSPSCSVLSDVR